MKKKAEKSGPEVDRYTMMEAKDELDENYQLRFYALFLPGEFQDKEILDYLIGDAVTFGLSDVLYNTYKEILHL